jgi:tRNA(fMet)-specific endonuclease VapC
MNYLLDTCVVSDFFKKTPSVIAHFAEASPNQLHISTITVMEIEYGLRLNKEREKKILPLWERMVNLVHVVPFCSLCGTASANLRANLKKSGTPIGPFDILIAGTAHAHNYIVVTSNTREFERLAEIQIENWR